MLGVKNATLDDEFELEIRFSAWPTLSLCLVMSPYVCWPMLSRMAIFVESLIKIKSIYFHVNFWHNFFVNVTKLKLETCVSFPKIFFQKLCENKLTLFWPLWQWGWANGWTPWWYNLFKMAIPDLFIIVYVINFLIENFGNKIKIKNMTCFEMKTQIKSSFSRNLNINNKQRQIWISRARKFRTVGKRL